MTVPTLPVDGQSNWGDPLNLGILQVNTTANNAGTAASNHAANIPADPHGDRAYAQGLVTPITTGVNGPNGYVKLNNSGVLPAGLVSGAAGGAFTNVYDAVAQYGAVANTGTDQATHIQNALNAASSAGGGVVWLGSGTFSLNSYLVIGNNTTLLMSPGTVLARKSSAMPFIISNVLFGTSNTPAVNVEIIGGKLDTVGSGGLSSTCTPIFLIQSVRTTIADVAFNAIFNNPCIELNGCTNAIVRGCNFDGVNKASGSTTVPAIRINVSNTTTTPAGLAAGIYSNMTCSDIKIRDCSVKALNNAVGPFASFVGSDLVPVSSFYHQDITIAGGGMPYNNQANFSIPSIFPNAVWKYFFVSNVYTAETSQTTKDSWITLTPQHGWSNSGNGPNLQFRLLAMNSGGSQNAITGVGSLVEVVGDLNAGTQTDNTVVFTLPSWLSFASNHLIPILAPGTNAAANMRFIVSAADNTVQCLSVGPLSSGGRVTFHAFVPMFD